MAKKLIPGIPKIPTEVLEAHSKDYVRSAKAVVRRRDAEVKAVLGRVPTFQECCTALKKAQEEENQKK